LLKRLVPTLQLLSLIFVLVGIVTWVGQPCSIKGKCVSHEAEATLLGGQQYVFINS
jgi:hypothetical protein